MKFYPNNQDYYGQLFQIFFIENGHCIKKEQDAKVHCNPKMSGYWTSNCFQSFKTFSRIGMKILQQ